MQEVNTRPLVDVFVLRSLGEAGEQAEDSCAYRQLESCLNLHGIVPLRTYLTSDGRRLLCHFQAPDADSLRMALRLARIDYDAVWSAKPRFMPGTNDSNNDPNNDPNNNYGQQEMLALRG